LIVLFNRAAKGRKEITMAKQQKRFSGVETNNLLDTLEAADSRFVKEVRAKLALPSEIDAFEADGEYRISFLKLSIWEKGNLKWVKIHEVHGPLYRPLWADVIGIERTIFRWTDVLRAIEQKVCAMVGETAIQEEVLVEFTHLVRALRRIYVDESLREEERQRKESVGGEVMADAFREAEAKMSGDSVLSTQSQPAEAQAQVA